MCSNCVSEGEPGRVRAAERRFPRIPSRRVRCVCFGRRVHASFGCELPRRGGMVALLPLLGKVVSLVRRKRKGTVLTTGRLLGRTGLPGPQGRVWAPSTTFLSGAAHCMRRQFEFAQTALVRLAAERRFPRAPSRCVRLGCFGRRVHGSFGCELPRRGGMVALLPLLGKVVSLVRRKRKGTVLTTGRLLGRTGLPGPQGRVWAPSTVLSCLGDVSPKPPAARTARLLWSASARVVCVRAAAALGQVLVLPLLGKVVSLVRRKRKGTVPTTVRLRGGNRVTWSSGTGVGSQHCAFLLGGRIPQTPCGAHGSFALFGECTGRLCASCRRSGAGFSPSLLGYSYVKRRGFGCC